ncbi:MAG: hypothetical protein K5930_12490 [Treponemataceae bacterium]|nr:hypothetical protein [Treponemataceae bacterium]
MRKAISLLLLAAFMTMTASAFEINGSVSSLTAGRTASINTIDIFETGNANLGLKFPLDFNKNTNLRIAGDFSLLWQVNSTELDPIADCTELSLIMAIPLSESAFGSFEMGRFSVKDCTELIFSQKLDGVRFILESPSIKAHLYGGYTGFLNARHNPMMPTLTNTGIYPTSPTYITADFFTYLPDIYEDKSIGLEVLGAFNPAEKTQNRLYTMVRIDGNFLYFIPYTLCTTLSWTNENNEFGHMANLSFASMEYTIDKTHFGGKIIYASGYSDNFSHFKQLSVIHADKGSSLLYTNLIKPSLFFDHITENDVKLICDVGAFMSLSETKDIIFNGIQWTFDLDIPFIKKSKLLFNVSQFIPIIDGSFYTNLSMYISIGF